MPARAILRLSTLALIVILSGCIYSTPPVVTWGQKYSKDALAFLNLPDTTREEVIATLGPPLYDLKGSRTMVYAWETTYDVKMLYPGQIGNLDIGSEPAQMGAVNTQWALFIALNESNTVVSHSISRTDKRTLDELSRSQRPPANAKQ